MLKILLITLLSLVSLNASIQKVKENYVIVQTAGDTYVGNELDQTYSLNPFLIGAGESIIIIDKYGNNTIELVGGLTITSSIVVSNELIIHLNNGASVNIRGADKFTFDIGANKVSSIIGTQKNFASFVTEVLGLATVPTQGEAPVNGGAIDSIIAGEGGDSPTPIATILSDLTLSSDSLYLNESKDIVARIALKGDIKKVELFDNNNHFVIALKDDGKVVTGDDILDDGVFSGKFTLVGETKKSIEYYLKINDKKVSAKATITIIEKFNNEELLEAKEVSTNALKKLPKNTSLTDSDLTNKLDDIAQSLKDNDKVKSVDVSNDKMFIKYTLKSGFNGGILFTTKDKATGDSTEGGTIRNLQKVDYKGYKNPFYFNTSSMIPKSSNFFQKSSSTSIIGNTKVLILAPFEYSGVSGLGVKTEFEKNPYFDVTYIKNYDVGVDKFKNLDKYGVIVFRTHANKSGVFLSGKEATEDLQKQYTLDIEKGRLIVFTHEILIKDGGSWFWEDNDVEKEKKVFLVDSSFIAKYNSNLPDSLVYLGMCQGLMVGNPLPSIFINAGAKSVVGFNDTVNTSYSNPIALTFFSEMLNKKTLKESLDEAKKQHGNNDGAPTPAEPVFIGDSKLKLFKEGIKNGSFEENLKFWEREGDVRVIPKLAELKPQNGSLMNIISTGLGSNSDTNSYVQQSFIVPDDIEKLQFSYDVISEEPMEFVGSAFDDKFEAHIIDENGNDDIVVTETVNTSTWYPIGGIDFDEGDHTAFHTKWKQVDIDISQYQGQPITVKFLTYDKGDSIYDTAVLLDDVKLQ